MRANQTSNQLRIIAGRWRGRKLTFAPVAGVRPTPDRVRETLFNWLAPEIQGSRCLDLFAGSGALGIEAASRGALKVVLVDNDSTVVTTLHAQLQQLQATQVEVIQADVSHWLATSGEPFDIVFLDPPFRQGLLPVCLQALDEAGWLAANARIYIEAERDSELALPAGWQLLRSKHTGQLGYHLAQRRQA